jgi:flagellar protein FlgJ
MSDPRIGGARIAGAPPLPLAGTPGGGDPAKLRGVARQMSGVFVEQLFKAMRATVPQGEGAFDGGSGEEMFSGLMDQHVAADTSTQWTRGLEDAIYRQLARRAEGDPGASAMPGTTPGAAPDAAPSTPPAIALHASDPAPQSIATPVTAQPLPAAAALPLTPRSTLP